jgi:hypothetical protein
MRPALHSPCRRLRISPDPGRLRSRLPLLDRITSVRTTLRTMNVRTTSVRRIRRRSRVGPRRHLHHSRIVPRRHRRYRTTSVRRTCVRRTIVPRRIALRNRRRRIIVRLRRSQIIGPSRNRTSPLRGRKRLLRLSVRHRAPLRLHKRSRRRLLRIRNQNKRRSRKKRKTKRRRRSLRARNGSAGGNPKGIPIVSGMPFLLPENNAFFVLVKYVDHGMMS